MVRTHYIPERGDVVWVNFKPTRGHEQSGNRPALVISPRLYNAKASLVLLCPITSKSKKYSYEVVLQSNTIEGVVLADQIRSIDWQERKVIFIEKALSTVVEEVEAKLLTLIVG